VRAPTQYHSAKCADGRENFLAVQSPAVAVADGLELHRRGVGAGVRLAVADRELDFVSEDLREELALELVVAVAKSASCR
jgi:hypothetical protein